MADVSSVPSLLLDTIPKELIPLIALALFLALTVFFTIDRRRKLLNGKAKYDVFVNTCIFSVGLITLYLFVLYVVGILFPTVQIKQIYDILVYMLWVVILGYIVMYFKANGREINKQELFTFLVAGLDAVFVFGTGLIIFFLISSLIRSSLNILPTYRYIYANLVILIPMLFPLILYLIARLSFIPKIAELHHLHWAPFIEPNTVFMQYKWVFLCILILLAIICFLFANWQISSTYERSIVSQTATFSGYLTTPYNESNTTITTRYKINLTHLGNSIDIPIEFVNLDEKPTNDDMQLFSVMNNIYWINASKFRDNVIEVTTNRQVNSVPYFTYSPPAINRNSNGTFTTLSFNFSGLKIQSSLFLGSTPDCSNLTVNTNNMGAAISYNRPNDIDIVTEGRYPNQNYYRVLYENESNQTLFVFNVVRPEKIEFNVSCLVSSPS